jgi:hypothetical protein
MSSTELRPLPELIRSVLASRVPYWLSLRIARRRDFLMLGTIHGRLLTAWSTAT